jgi:hypothetical protein
MLHLQAAQAELLSTPCGRQQTGGYPKQAINGDGLETSSRRLASAGNCGELRQAKEAGNPRNC